MLLLVVALKHWIGLIFSSKVCEECDLVKGKLPVEKLVWYSYFVLKCCKENLIC